MFSFVCSWVSFLLVWFLVCSFCCSLSNSRKFGTKFPKIFERTDVFDRGLSAFGMGLLPFAQAPTSQAANDTGPGPLNTQPDRKSTRLNSSHRCSSYAVFCLKKK